MRRTLLREEQETSLKKVDRRKSLKKLLFFFTKILLVGEFTPTGSHWARASMQFIHTSNLEHVTLKHYKYMLPLRIQETLASIPNFLH